jgi:hypothetical protein
MATIIARLTYKLDQYGTGIEWGTGEDVKANLWRDLDNLRNNNNRNNLLSEWKYKNAFETAERWHENGRKTFELMTWESSFATAILFAIYH